MSEWPEFKIGAFCDVSYGYTAKASQEIEGPRFLRITDIQNGCVDWDTVPSCSISTADFRKHRLNSGDIVFARTGATTGKSFLILDPPAAVAASYLIRLRIQQDGVLAKYVALYFQTAGYWDTVNAGISGSAQGGFNASKLAALSIPLPPLAEQKRIVAILDEAFAAIDQATANTQQNLTNARELFESQLNAVFINAWQEAELVRLSDLATEITDGDHLPPPKTPTGIPFITITNIDKDTRTIDFSDTFTVPRAYFDRLKSNRKPKKGDVLYTVTGSFGIPVIVPANREFCFQRHIGLVRPNSETDTTWVYYLLLSPPVFQQASDRATGTAQKTVSLKVLRSLTVPKVPLAKQRAAVKRLDMISAETKSLESTYQRKLAHLANLKQSILQKAFRGELTAVTAEAVVASS